MDEREAAAVLGRKGGRVKSARKAAAVRENGKKGGWPGKFKGPAASVPSPVPAKRPGFWSWRDEQKGAK